MSMRISAIWFLVFIEKLRGYPRFTSQTLNSFQPVFLKLCGPYCIIFFFFWELWIWEVLLTFPLLLLSNNCFVQAHYTPEVQIKFHLSVISLACWHLWVKAVKLSFLHGRGERMTQCISGSVSFYRIFAPDSSSFPDSAVWAVLRGGGWMSCQ